MYVKCVIVLVVAACCMALPTGENFKVVNLKNVTQRIGRVAQNQKGYKLLQGIENGALSMFLISTIKKASYFQALRICKNFDMRLFRVNSPEKNELIKTIIQDYTEEGPFWMAGRRSADGETWRWADNSLITYFNWDAREPNNAKGNENCIEVYHGDAVWDDQACSEKVYFICEAIYAPITDKISNYDYGMISKNDKNQNYKQSRKEEA